MSGLAGGMGVADVPSLDCVRFGLFSMLPMAGGVVLLGEEVLGSTWAAGAVLAPDGRVGHLTPSAVAGGENDGSSN